MSFIENCRPRNSSLTKFRQLFIVTNFAMLPFVWSTRRCRNSQMHDFNVWEEAIVMTQSETNASCSLLIMVAGAKGAIGSTMAVTAAELSDNAASILTGLTTHTKFRFLGDPADVTVAGWDRDSRSLVDAISDHKVLPEPLWQRHVQALGRVSIKKAPAETASLAEQVAAIKTDIEAFKEKYPKAKPVLVNLLPAACDIALELLPESLDALLATSEGAIPDLAYVLAALLADVPVVNFTPNTVELPAVCQAASLRGVPLAGRDGKTGQTYFKVVLASALKARGLYVDGWYSLNILGNADGKNLMDPDRACGKLQNKTNLLDDILGYQVGETYGEASHKVHIDYYPPRGDAKEAWDVIDFRGIFGLPMSLRLDLQGRDSILAAPMAMDLARWAAALKQAGIGGPIADLGFFFKKPVGEAPPLTFQEQVSALDRLERRIMEHVS